MNKYKTRTIEKSLNSLIGNCPVIMVTGPRQVGKTTLLFQAYEYLLKEKKISSQNILYFSCDQLKRTGDVDIFDVVNYYCETFHNSIIETLSQPVFILIDEAQYDKKWAFNGKLIFDASYNVTKASESICSIICKNESKLRTCIMDFMNNYDSSAKKWLNSLTSNVESCEFIEYFKKTMNDSKPQNNSFFGKLFGKK